MLDALDQERPTIHDLTLNPSSDQDYFDPHDDIDPEEWKDIVRAFDETSGRNSSIPYHRSIALISALSGLHDDDLQVAQTMNLNMSLGRWEADNTIEQDPISVAAVCTLWPGRLPTKLRNRANYLRVMMSISGFYDQAKLQRMTDCLSYLDEMASVQLAWPVYADEVARSIPDEYWSWIRFHSNRLSNSVADDDVYPFIRLLANAHMIDTKRAQAELSIRSYREQLAQIETMRQVIERHARTVPYVLALAARDVRYSEDGIEFVWGPEHEEGVEPLPAIRQYVLSEISHA